MNPTQTLQGKLTYAGIVISAVGAEFGGLATAAYGRLRINWRKK
jgi:hypothetical protein